MERSDAIRLKLARLAKIGRRPAGREQRQLIRTYFSSRVVKLDAAYQVLGESAPRERVNALVEAINPFEPCSDPVRFWEKPKRAGFRSICSLPNALRASSLMIKDIFEAVHSPGWHLYNVRGRGRDLEARRISETLQAGFHHCFVGDIRACYPSVNLDALPELLPIPTKVVKSVIDGRNMRFRRVTRKEDCSENHTSTMEVMTSQSNGPVGLLQGSPASNQVLCWLLRDLPRALGPDCRVFVLADDILVATRNENEWLEIEPYLLGYLTNHPAGPFELSGRTFTAQQGFERAGYRFCVSKKDGHIEVDFSYANWEELFAALHKAVLWDETWLHRYPDVAIATLDRKLSGFSALSNLGSVRAILIESILDQFQPRA